MFAMLRKLPAHLYYRARWYDADVGRFISRDPIGVEGGINLYSYSSSNPVVFVDPYGEFPELAFLVEKMMGWLLEKGFKKMVSKLSREMYYLQTRKAYRETYVSFEQSAYDVYTKCYKGCQERFKCTDEYQKLNDCFKICSDDLELRLRRARSIAEMHQKEVENLFYMKLLNSLDKQKIGIRP